MTTSSRMNVWTTFSASAGFLFILRGEWETYVLPVSCTLFVAVKYAEMEEEYLRWWVCNFISVKICTLTIDAPLCGPSDYQNLNENTKLKLLYIFPAGPTCRSFMAPADICMMWILLMLSENLTTIMYWDYGRCCGATIFQSISTSTCVWHC